MGILVAIALLAVVILIVLAIVSSGHKDIRQIETLIEDGRTEEAKAQIKKRLSHEDDDPVWHFLLGRICTVESNFEYGIVEYKILFKLGVFNRTVDRETVVKNLVDAYKKIGKVDDAIAFLLEENAKKESALTLYHLGNLYVMKGDLAHASEYLEKALQLQPGYAEALADKGHVLFKQGREKDAIETLENATRIDRRCYQAYFYMGELYRSKSMFDKAIENFETAKHDRDLKLNALYNIALCYKSKDMNKNVIEIFERLLSEVEASPYYSRIAPNVFLAEARYQLGDAYLYDKDFQAALDQWRIVQNLVPDFKDTAAKIQANSRFGKDRIQDFLIAASGEFEKISVFTAESFGFEVQKVRIDNNEKAVLVSVDKHARGRPQVLLWIVRYPAPAGENLLKDFEKNIHDSKSTKGIMLSPNGYSPTGIRYATPDKPFTLYGKAHFTKLLKDFERRHDRDEPA
jgi:tetratricopeptide (TPR) repeat protein